MTAPEERADAAPTQDVTGAKQANEEKPVRFSPEEEAALLQESDSIKTEANAQFAAKNYDGARARYDDALASCPNYRNYERAVLQSNIAACNLKLEQWKEAIKVSTSALDGLVEAEKEDAADQEGKKQDSPGDTKSDSVPAASEAARDEVEEEIISDGSKRAAPTPSSPVSRTPAEIRKADILRIRTKALLRRARARSEAGGWQNLSGAEEDYRALAAIPGVGAADMRTVQAQLRALPPRTKAAQEAEMAEMWGKLRQLGDGILKPFGLSTDNFKMVKDEKTGGYSMNFSQGGGRPSS